MPTHQARAARSRGRGNGLVSFLSDDGILRGECPMSGEQIADALCWMLLSRAVDERLIKLQRMGRVGVYGPVHGQEAAVVGSAMALDPEKDWMVPASREQPAWLRHGLPLANLFATYMGRFESGAIPERVNLLPRQQSIGAQLPHAVGLAWALKIRRLPGVVIVYLGEGASSEGDFHEACNLAGVVGAPVIFLLINNRYAISTPIEKQTGTDSLAARAIGYGFPGTAVDGNDLFAVYSTTTTAVNRAREGSGPSLIECRTYRMGFHNTSDNPNEYRDQAEVAAEIQRDPIARVRRYATRAGLWSTETEQKVSARIRDEIEAAQDAADAMPRPTTSSIFNHVYEFPPPRFEAQRNEALELERDQGQ